MLRVSGYRLVIVIFLLLLCTFSPAQARTPLQTSPPILNDTFGTAQPIKIGESIQETITPRGDADWFKFAIDHPGELQVKIVSPPANLDVVFRVWNANRDTISDWFSPLKQGGEVTGVIDIRELGQYFLEVRDGSDSDESEQPYTLVTAFTPTVDVGEPNDAFGTATPITIGAPITATILPARDADWYALDVDHHGELQVKLTGSPANLNLVFRVWNSNRDTLTDWFSALAEGGDAEGVIDLPAPGRYYLEVHDGSDDARSVQPYTLNTSFTPSVDVFEPNNDFGAAAPIKVGETISATMLPGRDADWFAFDVPHQGELKLKITNVAPELAMLVRIWNSNRDTISDWFSPLGKGGDTQGTFDLPDPGRYYLEVGEKDGARSIQPFTLRLDFTAAADQLEHDNDFGHAAPLGLDRSVQANILPAGDADWYYFDVANPGEVHLLATNIDPEMALYIRVWNANRDTITDWYKPLANGGDTEGFVDITTPGRYYLEVAADSGQRSIQPYNLQIGYAQSTDAHEPNDAFEVATPIQLNQPVAGAIWPAGDSDWYAVVAPNDGDMYVLATHVDPSISLSLRIWNSDQGVAADWVTSPEAGKDVTTAISVTAAMTYVLELRASDGNAKAISPYVLYASMQPIDPATVNLPGSEISPTAPVTATEKGAAPITTKQEITQVTPTGKVTILTSGQIGPMGGELFVAGGGGIDGARLNVPPGALQELTTINIGVTPDAPTDARFGLQPAGNYWDLTPSGLAFAQPVTITLPVPAGAEASRMFIGHWTGDKWVDLGGTVTDGLISAATDGFSTYGVFCGQLSDYSQVNFQNATPNYINLRYISGPSPTPETADTFVGGCPMPYELNTTWEVQPNDFAYMLLRPGMYEFNVAYPQPQPGVANSLFVIIPPGGGEQTISIKDDGATSDNPATKITFPGRQPVTGSNLRPIIACNATVPPDVVVTNGDPGATSLPSRIVLISNLKLEQLPPKGPGIDLNGVATDPESSTIQPYWTMSSATGKSTIAGDPVSSGAEIKGQFKFQPTTAGHYTVFLTVYDNLGLFDECRWNIDVIANAKPEVKVLSGRTVVEFGRLDDERSAGVGAIVPLPTTVVAGSTNPLVIVSPTGGGPVVWDGLTLCPTAQAGPFTALPSDPDAVIGQPAPVDLLAPKIAPDATNRWENPGRTCVWALPADNNGDVLQIKWEFPGPIFGSGTFYAAVAVPANFHKAVPDGIALGAFIRTNEQLVAYNAWVSALYNAGGVPPAIVWEAWDDPCLASGGGTDNPCPGLSSGGIENIVATVSDSFTKPPQTGHTAIAVLPEGEADSGDCSGVMFISSLTPNPIDPGPDESVTVKAVVSPLVEGCMMDMSIVGTDTYQNQAFIPTNKSGEASFWIPGGAEDVQDVVTARFCYPLQDLATPPPADQACQTPTGTNGIWVQMQVQYQF